MSKKLNTSSITNELSEGSAFFRTNKSQLPQSNEKPTPPPPLKEYQGKHAVNEKALENQKDVKMPESQHAGIPANQKASMPDIQNAGKPETKSFMTATE